MEKLEKEYFEINKKGMGNEEKIFNYIDVFDNWNVSVNFLWYR